MNYRFHSKHNARRILLIISILALILIVAPNAYSSESLTTYESLPYTTKHVDEPGMDKGTSEIVVKGLNGQSQLTYNQNKIFWYTYKTSLIEKRVTQQPVFEIVKDGTFDLEINEMTITSPIYAGDYVRLNVKTNTQSNCSIKVRYLSGYSIAEGLEEKSTDKNGFVSWVWRVGGNTTKGSHPLAIVDCYVRQLHTSDSIDYLVL